MWHDLKIEISQISIQCSLLYFTWLKLWLFLDRVLKGRLAYLTARPVSIDQHSLGEPSSFHVAVDHSVLTRGVGLFAWRKKGWLKNIRYFFGFQSKSNYSSVFRMTAVTTLKITTLMTPSTSKAQLLTKTSQSVACLHENPDAI